jgi:hypothetical protein
MSADALFSRSQAAFAAVEGGRPMKLVHDAEAMCNRIGKALHLDTFRRAFGMQSETGTTGGSEWVIVYRTAQGFCCMYHGVAVEFSEMLDVQLWSEEREVQTYYTGL